MYSNTDGKCILIAFPFRPLQWSDDDENDDKKLQKDDWRWSESPEKGQLENETTKNNHCTDKVTSNRIERCRTRDRKNSKNCKKKSNNRSRSRSPSQKSQYKSRINRKKRTRSRSHSKISRNSSNKKRK